MHARTFMPTGHILACAVVAALSLGTTAAHADAPLKLKSSTTVDAKKNEKRARDAVLGYYQALIKGDYEVAGTFVHPDTIEPIRRSLVAQIEKARPAQQAATLKSLGVGDLNSLKMLSMSQFFAVFAASQYGQTLQVMASPKLKAQVAVAAVRCEKARDACDVDINLSTLDATGKRSSRKQTVKAEKVAGRWLAGANPMGKR